jgi:tetratricopeptide (TPR) repeat protein
MSYGELQSSALVTAGRFDEAIAAADAEIRLDPTEPEARFNRGLALAGLERFAEAAEQYALALGLDASGSRMDPEALDDELFFALRREAERRAHPGQPAQSTSDAATTREAAIAILTRYRALLPEGRHVADIPKWIDKLGGVETVWVRDSV